MLLSIMRKNIPNTIKLKVGILGFSVHAQIDMMGKGVNNNYLKVHFKGHLVVKRRKDVNRKIIE